MVHEPLHEKERGARIDREHALPEPRIRILERSPVGERGGIDQGVDPAEPFERRIEDEVRRVGVLEIGLDEQSWRPASLDMSGRGRALGRVPAGQEDTVSAGARNRFRDA